MPVDATQPPARILHAGLGPDSPFPASTEGRVQGVTSMSHVSPGLVFSPSHLSLPEMDVSPQL